MDYSHNTIFLSFFESNKRAKTHYYVGVRAGRGGFSWEIPIKKNPNPNFIPNKNRKNAYKYRFINLAFDLRLILTEFPSVKKISGQKSKEFIIQDYFGK